MYDRLRPWLFRLDPERAHRLTMRLVGLAGQFAPARALLAAGEQLDPRLRVSAFALEFKNPVGLAAGYDKDGIAVRGLAALGFGHVEVGTVTLRSQAGNPRPRVWRFADEHALINSMGFPNAGVDALRVPRGSTRIGINIGKGKDTPLEAAVQDYCALFDRVCGSADYVVLNVSSPNTLGLRRLQARAQLEELLQAVTKQRNRRAGHVPLLVKIAPDLEWGEIDDVLGALQTSGLDGIIATNTTVGRNGMPEWAKGLKGGLSGLPLRARSTEVIRYIAEQSQGKLPIIGVGGIASAADALEKLYAGACLVQLYTGLVYEGPGLVRRINAGLLRECERVGAASISDLSGAS